jgi:tripartite ATP-independent transporter DctM subunit
VLPSLALLLVFLALVIVGVPVTFAVGLAAAFAVVVIDQGPAQTVALMMYTALNSFVLTAVPFFLLTGLVMERSRMADDLFSFARSLVGSAKGGLGYVNVLASLLFGGTSGSAAADAAGLGRMQIMAMVRQGYPLPYTAAITLSSSILSAIVPPSVIMVVYAQVAGVSAAAMLLAGIGPGLLFAAAMMTTNFIVARRRGWQPDKPFHWLDVLRSLRVAAWPIGAPAIIVGGIYSGFATPTEAGFLSALYVITVAVFIKRTIPLSALPRILMEAGAATAVVLFILAAGAAASRVFGADGIPQMVADLLASFGVGPLAVLFLIVVFLLVIGFVLEALAAVVILTPIFLPLVQTMGVDPIHFGVILIATLCVGLITPPVGVCLFIVAQISNLPIHRLSIAALPFLLSLVVALGLIVLVPDISLFLTR